MLRLGFVVVCCHVSVIRGCGFEGAAAAVKELVGGTFCIGALLGCETVDADADINLLYGLFTGGLCCCCG